MKGNRMSIIEIDTGEKLEKFEYIGEDIDTYIVSSDDIDLSKEGFVLKQKVSTSKVVEREFNPNDIDWFGTKSDSNAVEDKSKGDTIPLISVEYDSNIVEKKCKLVKKKDVIRYYDDWNKPRPYFCGISCGYKEMDGFIRIEPFKSDMPQERLSEFTYGEYLFDRGSEYPPAELDRYYKDISYDDVRFQRDTVTKYHSEYTVNLHGITKDMNEEERKQLTIEYLIKNISAIKEHSHFGSGYDTLSALLLGSYGYKIPDKLYATDLDSVFDLVLPRVYEIYSARYPETSSQFLTTLIRIMMHESWRLKKKDLFTSDMFWIEDVKIIYPGKDYAFFMNIQLHLRLINKHKNQEYPYNLINRMDRWELRSNYYDLKRQCGEYLTKHNPVYWNNKVVCDDLGDFVKNAMKELIYFKHVQ